MLNCSSIIFTSFMVYLWLFAPDGVWEPICIPLPKRMDKFNKSTNVWELIFNVSFMPALLDGSSGCFFAEHWYNTSCHSFVGTSPFEVLYGHKPIHFGLSVTEVTVLSDLSSWLKERSLMQALVCQHICCMLSNKWRSRSINSTSIVHLPSTTTFILNFSPIFIFHSLTAPVRNWHSNSMALSYPREDWCCRLQTRITTFFFNAPCVSYLLA